MLARIAALIVVVASFAAAGQARGLGADLPSEQLATISPLAVHGYFVNWSDVVFFQGDTEKFNQFLADVAKKQAAAPMVFLHEGKLQARSPWGKGADERSADWRTQSSDQNATYSRIDVWLGGNVAKDRLVLPDGVEAKPAEETK